MKWRFEDAKDRFDDLVDDALRIGPQRILCGNDGVVVISGEEYERLRSGRITFKQYLMQGEDFDDLDLCRDRSPMSDLPL